MTAQLYLRKEVHVPEDVKVRLSGKIIRVEGPLGTVEKDFSHAKTIHFSFEDRKIILETFNADRKTYSSINTLASKIKNMIIGVQRGYRYKMKIVYAHFPMNIKVDEKNNIITIENFLGRRGKIITRIEPGVKVKVDKEDIIIESPDIEAAAQTAANIREATKLKGKYRMSPHGREGGPGILDGVYIYAKEFIK
ncbi:MAG: 50S ribosomal protein L6 [Thermofilaceae archaeon]|nr:50S ribosomal protein L6 [Thermofilaceae archaeon]MDW8003660.1 50S ribosomal protein L6 [Thermofilaceae archaeon]